MNKVSVLLILVLLSGCVTTRPEHKLVGTWKAYKFEAPCDNGWMDDKTGLTVTFLPDGIQKYLSCDTTGGTIKMGLKCLSELYENDPARWSASDKTLTVIEERCGKKEEYNIEYEIRGEYLFYIKQHIHKCNSDTSAEPDIRKGSQQFIRID